MPSTRAGGSPPISPRSELERSLRRARRFLKSIPMAEEEIIVEDGPQRLQDYYQPCTEGRASAIVLPDLTPEQAGQWVFKTHFISAIRDLGKFSGQNPDDAPNHLSTFLDFCNSFGKTGEVGERIRLQLFPHSLQDSASRWYRSLPSRSIQTWAQMAQKFLAKYYPHSRTRQLIGEINTFSQEPGETLYDAWDRFKEMLMNCSHHGLDDQSLCLSFFNGLDDANRLLVNSSSGGSFMSKSPQEGMELLETMTVTQGSGQEVKEEHPEQQVSFMLSQLITSLLRSHLSQRW